MNKKTRTPFNMKEAHEPEFYIARLMTCNTQYHKFYKERIKAMEDHSGYLIFPESLLSMNQKTIYTVAIQKYSGLYYDAPDDFNPELRISELINPKVNKSFISLNRMTPYVPPSYDTDATLEDIIAAEKDNAEHRMFLCGGVPNSRNEDIVMDPRGNYRSCRIAWLDTPPMFTNRKAAQFFLEREQKRLKRESYKESP